MSTSSLPFPISFAQVAERWRCMRGPVLVSELELYAFINATLALRDLLEVLQLSNTPQTQTLEYLTPADSLRRQAAELERRDELIRIAREKINRFDFTGVER